jgi:hypothetical protein
MNSFFLILAQLSLVTLVYVFAYRAGYRSAQSKAVSVVKKFADPVTCLLDSLSETIDESINDDGKKELKKRTSNPPDADRHSTSNLER